MADTTCPHCGSARMARITTLCAEGSIEVCADCAHQPTEAQLILAELRAIREQLELLNRSPLPVTVVR